MVVAVAVVDVLRPLQPVLSPLVVVAPLTEVGSAAKMLASGSLLRMVSAASDSLPLPLEVLAEGAV